MIYIKEMDFRKNMKTHQNNWPKLLKQPKGKTIAVLAPHMDDEAIGCGGTILKHTSSDNNVFIIYITDSSKGMPNRKSDKLITETRKKESIQSNRLLGIKESFYLDLPDGNIKVDSKSCTLLNTLLTQIQPNTIYLPYLHDIHPDHQQCNKLFQQIAYDFLDCLICEYEVWSPLQPNVIVNINEQLMTKLNAIKAYKSQIKLIEYHLMSRALSIYRACLIPLPGIRYAEAFRISTCKEYLGYTAS